MNKSQEQQLTKAIRQQMTTIRNQSIVGGMRASFAIVLDICNKSDISAEEKVDKIKDLCEKGLKRK